MHIPNAVCNIYFVLFLEKTNYWHISSKHIQVITLTSHCFSGKLHLKYENENKNEKKAMCECLKRKVAYVCCVSCVYLYLVFFFLLHSIEFSDMWVNTWKPFWTIFICICMTHQSKPRNLTSLQITLRLKVFIIFFAFISMLSKYSVMELNRKNSMQT